MTPNGVDFSFSLFLIFFPFLHQPTLLLGLLLVLGEGWFDQRAVQRNVLQALLHPVKALPHLGLQIRTTLNNRQKTIGFW